MSDRLYNKYGSTQLQFDVGRIVDPKIHGLVSELMNIMKEYDVDPRDFKTYCMETMNIDFSQFFIGLGVASRKESENTPT